MTNRTTLLFAEASVCVVLFVSGGGDWVLIIVVGPSKMKNYASVQRLYILELNDFFINRFWIINKDVEK
jgi:hypothetical protein